MYLLANCYPHRWDALASIGTVAGSLVTIAMSGGVMTRSEDMVTQVMTRGEDSWVSCGVSLRQRLSQREGDQGGQGQQRPHGL